MEFLTSSMEVKMEVTQKIKICVMWGVLLLVIRAKKSKSNFRFNVPGLWRSVSQFMTSLLGGQNGGHQENYKMYHVGCHFIGKRGQEFQI